MKAMRCQHNSISSLKKKLPGYIRRIKVSHKGNKSGFVADLSGRLDLTPCPPLRCAERGNRPVQTPLSTRWRGVGGEVNYRPSHPYLKGIESKGQIFRKPGASAPGVSTVLSW